MSKIRFLTSGESHGQAIIGIIEGIPSNLPISTDYINNELRRRQGGYGRGGRMKIESDRAEIISGVRIGKTIGSPITLKIINKDWDNWKDVMSISEINIESKIENLKSVSRPRPGHADLAGALKYNQKDVRNILERSSARETAVRVALGSIAKNFLSEFGVVTGSYVIQIGSQMIDNRSQKSEVRNQERDTVIQMNRELSTLHKKAEDSDVRCPDKNTTKKMIKLIDIAKEKGDTLGGVFVVFSTGLPVGIGCHTQWDKRIEGRLSQAIMSIQAIKGIEIGKGFDMGSKYGSTVMDEIFYSKDSGFFRKTNYAGGIEGGITNGMPILLRAVMKPISTLRRPLKSVDIITKESITAAYERSDICAVPAASVIAEAMVALILADTFLEKFGGDSLEETKRNYGSYMKYISNF